MPQPPFEKYVPMAHRFAQTMSRRYGVPLPEMQDEALSALGYTIAVWNTDTGDGYKPGAGCSESTWVYRMLFWLLTTSCTKRLQRPMASLPLVIVQKPKWLPSLLATIGEDAKSVVSTILDAPAEIADDISTSTRARARKAVRQYLAEQGWDEVRIDKAWGEVQEAL